jgi:murein L,D-transpeptidase YcbB/YkuD
MVRPLGLPLVRRPEPGDVGYQHLPFQHHFLVESVGEYTYTSIDGNQGTPGVQRKNRAFKTPGVQFYSLRPLLRDTEPAPAPVRPTLRLGSTGDVVRTVQTILNAHGAQLVVDGQMGPVTVLAVQSLQRRAGLDADGVVGSKTWAVLEQL